MRKGKKKVRRGEGQGEKEPGGGKKRREKEKGRREGRKGEGEGQGEEELKCIHYTQCTGCLLEGVMHDFAEVHHCIHNDWITGFFQLVTAGGGEGG